MPTSASSPTARPATADARRVGARGVLNLRETGGYRAGDRMTRWGKLYRSGALHLLDIGDRAELRRRGIGIVIDLRDDEERSFAPGTLDGVEHVHAPVLAHPASTYIAADASLADLYDDVVDRSGPRLAHALRAIARSGPTPVLVHCTAGKDRTGLVVAFALELAGVGRDDILADYAASEAHLPVDLLDEIVERLRATSVPDAVNLDELVRRSPADVLARTFARIEASHGSVRDYLAAAGLADGDVLALREALLA